MTEPPVTTSAPASTARSTMPATRLALRRGDHGPDLGGLVGRVADGQRRDGRAEPGDEVVVDARPGDHAARGGAVLARVVVRRSRPACSTTSVEVGVVEHDDRCLAAELEVHPLERVGGVAGDELAGRDVAGERHHGHAGVARRGRRRPVSPWPHTTLNTPGGRMSAGSSASRSAVSGVSSDGLSTNVLPAARAGPELPGRHVQRVVPRGDAGAHAERVAPQHRRVVLEVLAGGLGLQGAGGAGEEPEVVDGEVELEVDDRHGLADVAPTRAPSARRGRPRWRRPARAASRCARVAWCGPRWRTPRPRRPRRRRRRWRRSTAPRR